MESSTSQSTEKRTTTIPSEIAKNYLLSKIRTTMVGKTKDPAPETEEHGTAYTPAHGLSNSWQSLRTGLRAAQTLKESGPKSEKPSIASGTLHQKAKSTPLRLDGRLAIGALRNLTSVQKINLRLGIDARHVRAANEFARMHNETPEVLGGEVGYIKTIEPRRILKSGILCREKETLAYFFVKVARGIVSGRRLSQEQVTAAFQQSRREHRPYADRFKDSRLYRAPMPGETAVGI